MSQSFEEKIKAKIAAIKNPQKFQDRNKNKWKPKLDAQSDIRLFRYPHNEPEEPFCELWFHYNVGFAFLCPQKMKAQKCLVCEASKNMYAKGGKENFQVGRDLKAKQRFVAVMVDRSDAELTPRYWEFSEKIYLELLQKLVDRDYKSYLDPIKGYDMTVTSQKVKDKKYPDVSFQFRPVQCRLAETDKKIKEIIEFLPKIETVYEMLSEDQIKQRLNDFWQKDEFPPKEGQEVKTEEISSNTYTAPELDIDSAFEKALDD